MPTDPRPSPPRRTQLSRRLTTPVLCMPIGRVTASATTSCHLLAHLFGDELAEEFEANVGVDPPDARCAQRLGRSGPRPDA